jgi:hypothetical protein
MSDQMLQKEYFPVKIFKQPSDKNISPFDVVVDVNSCGIFKEKGILCDKCFHQELIDKLESFSTLERLDFIGHQISLYPNPSDFLKRLYAFLNDNEDSFSSFGYSTVIEFKHIITQILQKEKPIKDTTADNNGTFIDLERLSELEGIESKVFDLSRLIRLCQEINHANTNGCYISLIMLTRSLIDHVPPIFGQDNFANVYGQYGTKSFKDQMKHLDLSMRKIADSYLHTQIRKKEVLPNAIQVNFSQAIDVLLAEIIIKLKK